ncbi:MAG: hypothetical protein QXZ09_08865 [Candidatus Methanomethylicaceae archaeon]
MATSVKSLEARGEQIYRARLRALLEPDHIGEFVAIEVESGDYFVGPTIGAVLAKAGKKYPDKRFHIVRIGYPVVASFKHRFSL